ncbi:DPP IV N-terminal domain-containing protein [Nonomuraea typhae]|uniref:DPP IV N-terminal domain-containing protein n=1 Tax=Nonomuraea typhae TaxID=2603600 RepID=A0ABW7ZBI1_9ACTN
MTENTRLDASAYRAAEQLMRNNRGDLVHGAKVRPHWIDGGARFWYTVTTGAGRRFVLADPEAGTREPAFDHERLAAALTRASGQEADASALPLSALEFGPGTVSFRTGDGLRWTCALDTYACTPAEAAPPAGFMEPASPDGRHAVFLREHNLWLRSAGDGRERALTADGEADLAYGLSPFSPTVLLNKLGLPGLPPAVAWSPDSTRLLTHRTDQRRVRRTHLVRPMPEDGGEPALVTQRFAFPGDEHLPEGRLVVIDIATGRAVPAESTLPMPLMSPISTGHAWWAEDGTAVYFLQNTRDLRTLWLKRLDPATGEVTTLVTETGPTRVEPAQFGRPMVKVLSSGEVLWYSQRDGWGHLYLYGGPSERQITSGEWAVREILHVDEAERVVYFVAAGLIAEDPYRRSVCRAALDGSGFARITGDDLDHDVTVAAGKEYFIDSASTTNLPPVISVRGWDGAVRVELERADISRLLATGWSAPERFRAKAADGVTDVYGIVYKPHGFDPRRTYPVIDHPYPGPHANRVSAAFDSGILGHEAEPIPALGFVVIALDGRGTPGRDKAFHDYSYQNYQVAGGMEDHVAALRQLAGTRPWMDLDRVGIFGLSGGGFATVRAMADFPDVYKVGVAEAGNHDNRFYHAGWGEAYDGPDYVRSSNVEAADRIRGKLLLIHGGSDDNVHPHHTLRLAERLIALDKDVDMFIIPGAEHAFVGYEHQVSRRRWDYLVRNLLGLEPPEDYRITPTAIDLEMLAELFG